MKEPNLQRMSKEDIDKIKIDAYMSKEQTPIEEWFNEEHPWILNLFKRLEIDEEVLSAIEQYAQAKVLEALERFIDWAFEDDKHYKSKDDLIKDFLKQK